MYVIPDLATKNKTCCLHTSVIQHHSQMNKIQQTPTSSLLGCNPTISTHPSRYRRHQSIPSSTVLSLPCHTLSPLIECLLDIVRTTNNLCHLSHVSHIIGALSSTSTAAAASTTTNNEPSAVIEQYYQILWSSSFLG